MKSLKISDGNSLFAEVHQLPAPLSPVHVVVPHTPEAEQMILMMNKNFPAYISFVLEDQGFSKDFISELIERSCCQTKAREIHLCSWNRETLVLTTPRDKTATCDEEKMLQALWFKNAFAELPMVKREKASSRPLPRKCSITWQRIAQLKQIITGMKSLLRAVQRAIQRG